MNITELLIIAVVAIIVLGPEKLPKTIVELVKILKLIKAQINDAKSSIEAQIKLDELRQEAQKYQDEIGNVGKSVRKKLSFEEFDEIKKELDNVAKTIETPTNEISLDDANNSAQTSASNAATNEISLDGNSDANPQTSAINDTTAATNEIQQTSASNERLASDASKCKTPSNGCFTREDSNAGALSSTTAATNEISSTNEILKAKDV